MRCLRPAGVRRGRSAVETARLGVVAAVVSALALGGCAASQQSKDYQSYSGVPYPGDAPRRVAVATPPGGGRPASVIEGDGLPSQAAPMLRPNSEPDDPSEPFSPNYGPPPASVTREAPRPPARPKEPAAAPVRRATVTEAEADAIVAQAIVAHELRKP